MRLAIALAAAVSETDPETSDVPFLLVAAVLVSCVVCWVYVLGLGVAALLCKWRWLNRVLRSRSRREEKEALVPCGQPQTADAASINLESVSEL